MEVIDFVLRGRYAKCTIQLKDGTSVKVDTFHSLIEQGMNEWRLRLKPYVTRRTDEPKNCISRRIGCPIYSITQQAGSSHNEKLQLFLLFVLDHASFWNGRNGFPRQFKEIEICGKIIVDKLEAHTINYFQ
ncbi:hypothetical protein BVG16_25635 [Paenibacillus selenitireducens]|uniref:Uncharacterized protein n=1 Tax=Paenibacillus selenitireducens TaxID=1324314 RepID=A0A1T2X3I2_9BACL|nr:hypothetical protein BVG16_25635 [Paenibacillus selenitireducens]